MPLMQRFLLLFASLLFAAVGTAQASLFVHEFGASGQKGSFRVQFDDQGAGVHFLQTMDHFATAEAKAKPAGQRTSGDYMLLVWSGNHYSFGVGEPVGTLFPNSLWTSPWTRTVDNGEVRFAIESGTGLVLTKVFRHRPDQRGLSLELRLENRSMADVAGRTLDLELLGPGLVNVHEMSMFGASAFAIAQAEGGVAAHRAADASGATHDLLALEGRTLRMVGSSNRFFGGFLFPLDDGAKTAVRSVRVESLPPVEHPEMAIHAHSMPRALLRLALPVPAVGAATVATFGAYLGPKSFRVFDESPEHARFLPILDVDLEPPCCGVTVPGGLQMATLLVKLLSWFHDGVGHWGVAIMLLTLLVRGLLAPLNFRMQKSMREYGKRMAVVKPKLDALKTKYADDQKAYQQAMLQFQREHKLMPPLGGCLPIFLTMPIYIGLFTALRTAYDLRQEGFLYIADLSHPDAFLSLSFWPHHFNLLPLLWITLMLVLQLKMPLPTDPQQRQMQQIMRFMPLMFGVMLYNYAAGLLVYMVTSMLWTFVESAITKKILGPIDPNAAAMAPTPVM